jgi:hypothetical protein
MGSRCARSAPGLSVVFLAGPCAGSILAAGRAPECTQKVWPCKSNSVRLGSLPRELPARRLPSGFRPGFWPQGQWDLLYSFASQVAGASRSASTSSRRLSPYGFFTTVDPTVSGGAVRSPRRCLHARRTLRAKRRRPPCGGAGPHPSTGYTGHDSLLPEPAMTIPSSSWMRAPFSSPASCPRPAGA